MPPETVTSAPFWREFSVPNPTDFGSNQHQRFACRTVERNSLIDSAASGLVPQWYGVRNARTKVTSVSTPIDLGGDEWLDVVVEFLLLVECLVIMVATAFIFPEPLKAEARIFVWEDWREPLCG